MNPTERRVVVQRKTGAFANVPCIVGVVSAEQAAAYMLNGSVLVITADDLPEGKCEVELRLVTDLYLLFEEKSAPEIGILNCNATPLDPQ